jgi:hypothetical protein
VLAVWVVVVVELGGIVLTETLGETGLSSCLVALQPNECYLRSFGLEVVYLVMKCRSASDPDEQVRGELGGHHLVAVLHK